ncbi:hypothetical protein OSB04_002784 [Centaurea solstitialis]|uniref:DUF4283 domain-containing protein n=1 Tax=Centaurea solstitialis TaxID=347529 RepID=A0AA38TTJ7_9ASTR|nr:hypothetical protein OSB04_002784 [Centaurea solstitialis]
MEIVFKMHAAKLGINFENGEPMLVGYSDSDMAGNIDNMKSTSVYLMTFVGGAASWQSRIQKCVALSTTKVKYMVATKACKELLTKHIDVRYHWIKDAREYKIFELDKVHIESEFSGGVRHAFTETESDEEDYLTRLTRKLRNSTLQDDFWKSDFNFKADSLVGFVAARVSSLLSSFPATLASRSPENFVGVLGFASPTRLWSPIGFGLAKSNSKRVRQRRPLFATTAVVPACGGADGVRPSVGSSAVIADCKTNSTTAASFFSPDQRSSHSSPTVVMSSSVQLSSAATPPAVLPVQSGAVGDARESQPPPPGPAVVEPFLETSAGTTGVIGDVGSFQQLLRDVSGAHGHQQHSPMLSLAAAMFSSFLASSVGMGSGRGVLRTASVSSLEAATLSSPRGSLKPSADKLDEVGSDIGNEPTMSEEKVPNAGSFVDSEGKVHLHADETDVAHKPVSFADLLKKSANLVCGKGKLTYYPPVVTELGTRRAIIPDELVQKQASEWALTLAGYFIGKRPAFPFIWQPGLCFDKPELKTVPLWVNIYGLPLDVWDYEIISRIASVVGEPVSVDRYTDEVCVTKSGRANFARVLVNVSADYELPSNIDAIILGKLRKFKTEFLWKPKCCPLKTMKCN